METTAQWLKMKNQLKQNRAEVFYLTSLLLFVLAPKFTAIDSVGIRWFLVSISGLFYSIYYFTSKPYIFRYEKIISLTLLVLIFSSTLSLFLSNNINESIFSLSKILIIVSTFYLSFNALLRVNISNDIVIGDNCKIGAGKVIMKNVSSGHIIK